jgi:LmbE family N-acetylglucosaminyl deacetylase
VRTLVIAPHPDDETLGAGGTLLRRKQEGAGLAWVIVTGIAEANGWEKARVEQRSREIAKVGELYGFDAVFNLGLDAARLDRYPIAELVEKLSACISEFRPNEVLVPSNADVHTDHQIVSKAAASSCKWFRSPSVHRVLAYEVLSETDFSLVADGSFHPNFYVNIEAFIEKKLEIMREYPSELGAPPFPRSEPNIRALATFRGSAAGYLAAEAFQVLRDRS